MKFLKTDIEGVLVIEPKVHEDDRGFFMESYRKDTFAENGIAHEFVQDNHSFSMKGTLRGLHYQAGKAAQAKLVRVVSGEIYDVAVDIRKGSPTYGRWVAEMLSPADHRMMYIPPGLAHGFLVTQDHTHVIYKTSTYYSPEHERGVRWDDPAVKILWPKIDTEIRLSKRDSAFPSLDEALTE